MTFWLWEKFCLRLKSHFPSISQANMYFFDFGQNYFVWTKNILSEQMDQAFRSLITALQLPMFSFPKTDAEVRAFQDVWLLVIAAHTHASVCIRAG